MTKCNYFSHHAMYIHFQVHGPEVNTQGQCKEIILKSQVRQNALSSVRSRSTTTRKAGNLATILIVIGKMINHCFVIVISHVKYLIFAKPISPRRKNANW